MINKSKKLASLFATVLFCAGCGPVSPAPTTVDRPVLTQGTYFEFKVDTRKVDADLVKSAPMIDTIQNLVSQRLEKQGITTAQVSKSWLDPTIVTVKLGSPNTLSPAQALELVKPLQLSFKEHTTNDDTIWQDTGLTGKQLERAFVSATFGNSPGDFNITLEFNTEGKALFSAVTKRNINKSIGIFLDDVLVSNPMVQGEITQGEAVINGAMSLKEMQQLTNGLNLGVLDIPITLQKAS